VKRHRSRACRLYEALRVSEERFRALTESTSDWIWEVDANGVYTYASPKVKDLLGYKPEEVIGKTPFDLMPLDEAERVRAIFQDIVSSQRPFERVENINLHKDGRRVVLETSGVPFFDKKGNLSGYRGIDRDITERKMAEKALREREAELETKTNSLEEVNTALRVLLKRRDEEKVELNEKVLCNVKELIVPYLEKLKKSPLDPKQVGYLNILESNLNNIISAFSCTLSAKYLGLTPKEILVANLIKEGKTNKEIGEVLALSIRTIETHRKHMRKKLSIENKKENLRTHLLTLQ
jgi:PAS domain S-box-containing protein